MTQGRSLIRTMSFRDAADPRALAERIADAHRVSSIVGGTAESVAALLARTLELPDPREGRARTRKTTRGRRRTRAINRRSGSSRRCSIAT